MKKILLTMVLAAGFTVYAWAEHPTAEHPKAEQSSVTEEAIVNSSIEFLVNNGVPAAEAENAVKQAVNEAKAQGLEGEALETKVKEAAQEYVKAQKTEHPAAGSEHPAATSEHPKAEHPGR